MTLKLIKQLEMINKYWAKYEPTSSADKELKKKTMKMITEQIEDSRLELLYDQENFHNPEMELDFL